MARWLRMALVAATVLASVAVASQLMAPRVLAAGDVLDQSNPGISSTRVAALVTGPDLAAQTFTAGFSGSLDRIQFALAKQLSPANGTIQIETVDSSHHPSGTVIGSGSIPASSVGTVFPSGLTDLPLSNPAPIVAGTQYAIVLSCAGCDGGDFYYAYEASSVYAGGQGYINTGSGWVPSTNLTAAFQSFAFQTYVVVRPTLTSQASGSVTIGGSVSDTATLSGGFGSPTGNLFFLLVGPNDPNCAHTGLLVSTKPVSGNGMYTSASYTPLLPGTYQWFVGYSGDSNNLDAAGTCGDPAETFTVSKATPSVSTTTPSTAIAGGTVSDGVSLSGGYFPGSQPTGYIQYNLYGPTDPHCAGTPVFTTYSLVGANGLYSSSASPPLGAGTYHWVDYYSGDVTNNTSVTTTCGDPHETVTVSQASPGISTQATTPITIGSSATDTATLTSFVPGSLIPSFITLVVYGPTDTTCAGPPVAATVRSVTGNGTYTSDPFTPASPGTYHWRAFFTGDSNNIAAATSCGDSGETLVVNRATPAVYTYASAATSAGHPASDSATLFGGYNATGTITFTLYGPNDPTCAGPAVFTSSAPVISGGMVPSFSSAYTPTTPGSYHWVASYGGDANNNAATAHCGDAGETTVVSQATTSLTTQAAGPIAIGGSATDTATLAGGASPTGTITFKLYGPTDPTCAAAPVFTSSKPVSGNGSYASDAYIPLAGGAYHWVASYSGDTANAASTTACGDPGETVTVGGALSSTPNAWVIVHTGPTSCAGSMGITVSLDASTTSGAPAGSLSYLDPTHGITLTSYQILTLQRTGNTAVVIASAMQNGMPVIARLVVTAGTSAPCSGMVQVMTSTGYASGTLPAVQSQVSAIGG